MQPNPTAETQRIEALAAAFHAIQPIAALLLETGVSYHEFARLTRRAYIDEAAAKQRSVGARPSISRIAAAPGMSRPEVSQALAGGTITIEKVDLTYRPADHILAAWTSDPDFLEADGKPKHLTYADTSPNFSDLVKKHGTDIPPRAMLNELLASRLVSETAPGYFAPANPAISCRPPRKEALRDFGAKLNTLGYTLLRNLHSRNQKPLFEAMTLTNNIPATITAKVSRELERRCRTFSQAIERFLLDQGSATTSRVQNSDCHDFGVMVAVVERAQTNRNETFVRGTNDE